MMLEDEYYDTLFQCMPRQKQLDYIVQDCRYPKIIEELTNGELDVNQSLNFNTYNMTGLEYSVYIKNWKMVAIFLTHGADPKNNTFNGIMQTYGSILGRSNPKNIEGFSGNQIPGFEGLRALINPNDKKSLSYIFLMETLSKKELKGKDDIAKTIDSIHSVHPNTKKCVLTSLLCMSKHGLPKELSDIVLEYVIITKIWNIFENLAKKTEEETK